MIRFLLDENMSAEVAEVLRAEGHLAEDVREHLESGAPDEWVMVAADNLGAVVLTFDRDFLRLATRRPSGNVLRHRRAGRVVLACPPPRVVERLRVSLPLLVAEHSRSVTLSDPRVLAEIGVDTVRIDR